MVTANKRVLVVDDESIVCESYRSVLTDEGYSVCTARSGRDALAACRAETFDVVLADLRMPDMDGLEVARRVRKEFPQVPILIITGYPTPQSADEARGLGVFDYLSKPLAPERLSAVTAAALSPPIEGRAPAVPVSEPVPEEGARTAEPQEPQPDAVAPAAPMGIAKTLGVLAVAPLLGLAYVMFLPIIGFGMLFSVIGMGLATKLGWMKRGAPGQQV